MILKFNTQRVQTLQDPRDFTAGNESFDLEPVSHHEGNRLIEQTLRKFRYEQLGKAGKGSVKAYLEKATGRSRAQITRLIAQHRASGQVRDRRGTPGKPYTPRYTAGDIRLLAETDRLHEGLSGPAVRHICQRQYEQFGESDYQRLAQISIAHLYRLRRSRAYQARQVEVKPTRPVKASTIGERRKPCPDGCPGYLRIDTVHQGDLRELWDRKPIKGVYYLNVVDEVTQWESVVTLPALDKRFVQPALEAILDRTFPFHILGFHSDNGSEFVNHATAKLLQERATDFTRSRARRSNDNGLVETKNAVVVRRQFGFGHIPVTFVSDLNHFTAGVLAEHLNFHRPCWFPQEHLDRRGRVVRRYPPDGMMTPYEKLCSIPEVESFLRPGITLRQLDRLARRRSDNQSAKRLLRERGKLFEPILDAMRSVA